MTMQVLTYSEKLLLGGVGIFAISLTLIVIFCVVKKTCWLHQAIWYHDKKKKQKVDDIICIRYPPDIYPTSVGIYRENLIRSPEEELARLFHSAAKRDSTYSSMSEGSSGYELTSSSPHGTSGSNTTTINSPTTATVVSSPDSPEHPGSGGYHPYMTLGMMTSCPASVSHQDRRRLSLSQLTSKLGYPTPTASMMTTRSASQVTAAAIATEAAIAANHRFSLQLQSSDLSLSQAKARQPFFTFILKYEENKCLVHIEFIEARNLPSREYLNQPCDVFFTLEIHPKKPSDRKKEMIHYRFVTKTIKKAGEICDFSETFLAQLPKAHLKDYLIKFSAFDQDRHGNPTEIGTTSVSFDDFRDFTTNKLVLSCSLKESMIKRGEIMIGMCYLPTAERMSVTIGKLMNLNPYFSDGTITKQSICYVRVLLLRTDTGKVIKRKRTTFQKLSGSGSNAGQPVFNETIVFDMPPTELIQTVVLALVCLTDKPRSPKTHQDESSREQDIRSTRHPGLSGRVSDESIFHYSDNLNQNRRSSSLGSNTTTSSRTSVNSNQSKGNLDNERRSSPLMDCKEISTDTKQPETTSHGTTSGTETSVRVKDSVVGKVALGYCVRNPIGKYHWDNMMRSPRNVVTEWHNLK